MRVCDSVRALQTIDSRGMHIVYRRVNNTENYGKRRNKEENNNKKQQQKDIEKKL